MRLKLLFSLDRNEHPLFATEQLAETLKISTKKVNARAKTEGWQSLQFSEVLDGEVSSYPMWDALSMPVETRRQIAVCHYTLEEKENPLYEETLEAACKPALISPLVPLDSLIAAIYRARQFSMIHDVAVSLELTLLEALEVISTVYRLERHVLAEINRDLDRGNPCSFIALPEDERSIALLQYFMRFSGNLLPEISRDMHKKCLKKVNS